MNKQLPTTQVISSPSLEQKSSKSKKKIVIIVVLALVIMYIICCAIFWAIGNSSKNSTMNGSDQSRNSPTVTKKLATPTITSTPIPTYTPISPKEITSTWQSVGLTSTAVIRTRNARHKQETATEIASYHGIYVKDLSTYADKHIGEKIKMYIVVFNINGDTELQGYMNGTYEPLYVIMAEPFDDIYEHNGITVYGTVGGEMCGENAFGGQVCQPVILESFYVK